MRPTTLIAALSALAVPAFGELAVCISPSLNQLCIHPTLSGDLAHCLYYLHRWPALQREMDGMEWTPLYALPLFSLTRLV